MRKRPALLAAFLLVAAVSFARGGRGKPRASGSIELGNTVSYVDRQRLLQDLERHKHDLAESERVREGLRREYQGLLARLAEQEKQSLQRGAEIRGLKEQFQALRGPEANLDRYDDFARSCRSMVGSCADLFERLSRKCGEKGEGTEETLPEERPAIEEKQQAKNEKET